MIGEKTKQVPERPSQGHLMSIAHWPKERRSEGLGMSAKDGWHFGIGFGLALAIAVPLIVAVLFCFLWFVIAALGLSLGELL